MLCHDHVECLVIFASCIMFILYYIALHHPCFVLCFMILPMSFLLHLHHEHHALVCILKSCCVISCETPSSSYLHLIHATYTYQQPFIKFTQVSIPFKLLLSSLLHLFSCDIFPVQKMFHLFLQTLHLSFNPSVNIQLFLSCFG